MAGQKKKISNHHTLEEAILNYFWRLNCSTGLLDPSALEQTICLVKVCRYPSINSHMMVSHCWYPSASCHRSTQHLTVLTIFIRTSRL